MQIKFNYRYYTDETEFETYACQFNDIVDQRIATQLVDVGEVVDFAESAQQQGHYVALYLPYEAARYFNDEMTTCEVEDPYVYAAAYVLDEPGKEHPQEASSHETDFAEPMSPFEFQLSDDMLVKGIQKVQDEIVRGNTYQVNYTSRLKTTADKPISALYETLQQQSNGFYTALIDTPEVQVVSISPELFFQQGHFKSMDNVIVSKPMKGTMPRGRTDEEDEKNAETLAHSEKDRAENVMIVDLLRNDISRIAREGSVKVYQLFAVEHYATVLQMTSMVTGQLRPTQSLVDILRALFPCGSITGAPKLNTMKYIAQLEQQPRHIYCGTIGLLLPNGKRIFNVPIRTIQYINQQAIYGVGAGITIDSDPMSEVREFKDKTSILEAL